MEAKIAISGRSARVPIALLLTFVILLAPLPLAAFVLGTRSFGLLAFVILAIVLVATVYLVYRQKRVWKRFPGRYPEEPDWSYRVHVFADPERLAKLEHVRDEFFEPIVFPLAVAELGPAAWRLDPRLLRRRRVALIVSWVVLIVVFVGGLTHFLGSGRNFTFVIHFVIPVLMAASVYLLPAYIRFVPGRVGIIVYPLFGMGRPTTQEFDLTNDRVIIDRFGLTIGVEERAVRIEWTKYAARGIDELIDGAPIEAALRASISTAKAPRIPEGELTG